jgi:hypothetical protein
MHDEHFEHVYKKLKAALLRGALKMNDAELAAFLAIIGDEGFINAISDELARRGA